MMKACIFFITVFTLSLCSAFWTNYMEHIKEKNQHLETIAEQHDQELYKLRLECNRLSKERNAWIIEANRLKRRSE
jgi:FtsZ-binding cell division protein ZapB